MILHCEVRVVRTFKTRREQDDLIQRYKDSGYSYGGCSVYGYTDDRETLYEYIFYPRNV